MNHLNILEILKQKPSVHKLCYGGFIQEALQLKENVYAIPLKALGFVSEAGYASQYVVEICGGNVEQKQFDSSTHYVVMVYVIKVSSKDLISPPKD